MLNIDHSPPNSSPPQAEGGITKQAIAPIDTNTGGDITAVGTLRFGRGAVADLGQGRTAVRRRIVDGGHTSSLLGVELAIEPAPDNGGTDDEA